MTQYKLAAPSHTPVRPAQKQKPLHLHESNAQPTATAVPRTATSTPKPVELSDSLRILGIDGPSGFAPLVHDLIAMKAAEARNTSDKLFVYHPDNFWHPAFHRLAASSSSGLPAAFAEKSDDLGELCRAMLELRGTAPSDAVFHLLMPAWDRLSIAQALHFPDELQPLRIEGMTFNGGPFVTMHVPDAQEGLLRGIRNLSAVEDAEGGAGIFGLMQLVALMTVAGWVGGRVAKRFGAAWAFWPGAIAGVLVVFGVILRAAMGEAELVNLAPHTGNVTACTLL